MNKKYNVITSIEKNILPILTQVDAKKRMNRLLTETKGKVPENFFPPTLWMEWLNNPGKLLINYGYSQLLSIAYTWYTSRVEYAIDPQVLKLVINSELPEKLPTSLLKTIPLWSGYVNLQDNPIKLYEGEITGILISRSLTEDNQPIISVVYPNLAEPENPYPITLDILMSDTLTLKEIVLRDKGIIKAAKEFNLPLDKAFDILSNEDDHFISAIKAFINIVFYIASTEEVDAAEKDTDHFIERHAKINKRGEYSLPFRSALRQIILGKEDSEAINDAHYRNTILRECGEPHIRRGHFHGYWTGPKNDSSKRLLQMKWLKPTVVKGKVKQ